MYVHGTITSEQFHRKKWDDKSPSFIWFGGKFEATWKQIDKKIETGFKFIGLNKYQREFIAIT